MVTATRLNFPCADGLDKQLGTTGEIIGDTFLIFCLFTSEVKIEKGLGHKRIVQSRIFN